MLPYVRVFRHAALDFSAKWRLVTEMLSLPLFTGGPGQTVHVLDIAWKVALSTFGRTAYSSLIN